MVEQQANQSVSGGSNPTSSLQILPYDTQIVDVTLVRLFIRQHHYSGVMPRLTKLCLGGFRDRELKAAITLGWGVRPLHTIRKLFPSLTTKDYLEIGKLCLVDEEPRNSESKFISQVIFYLKQNYPELKILFTWADAMWGKPGYIYQASNFLYGGFIWTDIYCDQTGQRIHPRQLRMARKQVGSFGKARPSTKELKKFNWKHYFGKQFRYLKFLCPTHEQKKLLQESTVSWSINYPKDIDLEWRISTGQRKRIPCKQPKLLRAFDSR